MKKYFLYLICFIILCFLIPSVFTKRAKETITIIYLENVKNVENKESKKEEILNEGVYDYKNYSIVKVLHTKKNEIEEILLDEYLYGVVASEMPVDFETEALKAQAVVARTYTIYKIQNNNRKTW